MELLESSKTIERFEPNGQNPPNGFYYNPDLLNKNLKSFNLSNLNNLKLLLSC